MGSSLGHLAGAFLEPGLAIAMLKLGEIDCENWDLFALWSGRLGQATMRHSSIALTMNVYTNSRLLDVQGNVEALPESSAADDPNQQRQRLAAGAENFSAYDSQLDAPEVAQNHGFGCVSTSSSVNVVAFPQEKRPTKRRNPKC